jgi:FkbM family methyltransferase
MSRLKFLWNKTLLHYFWEEFQVRFRFKYVLPKKTETVLDDIRLDLSSLSLKVRNRILMGIYEAHEKRLCEEFLNSEDAVLEIGGAIGFIGLVCQKRIGIHQYFVFEANPGTLEVLRRNYQLNGLHPTAWNLALGPSDGTLDLDVASDFWENSVVRAPEARQSAQAIRVPSASFRTLLDRVGQRVNVLIIDVEGAEQFIDLDQIPREVNKIIMEIHPQVLGPEKTYDLISGLIQRGFYVAREESGTFAFLKRQSNERPPSAPPRWQAEDEPEPLTAGVSDAKPCWTRP